MTETRLKEVQTAVETDLKVEAASIETDAEALRVKVEQPVLKAEFTVKQFCKELRVQIIGAAVMCVLLFVIALMVTTCKG